MDKHENHIDFYKNLESPFDQSEEDLWTKIEEKTNKRKTKRLYFGWIKYAAAAMIIFMLGAILFMRIYTETIASEKGQHLSYTLPDGSVIDLNAASSLKYKPYWWNFDREVIFEGEGFFDIQKGKKFSIISTNGVTEILGTSFNIYARNKDYKVFCKTGKVKVTGTNSVESMIITPGEYAVFNSMKLKGVKFKNTEDQIMAWKSNKFVFVEVNLQEVLQELERQYNIEIEVSVNNSNKIIYTGFFTKDSTIEKTLDIICKTLDLNHKKLNENKYLID